MDNPLILPVEQYFHLNLVFQAEIRVLNKKQRTITVNLWIIKSFFFKEECL